MVIKSWSGSFFNVQFLFCLFLMYRAILKKIINIQTKPTIPQTTLSRVFVTPPVVRFA